MQIEDCRSEIDAIDAELVRLLNRRASVALRVGRIKEEKGLSIHDPLREREVITNASLANCGPLEARAVEKIFRRIIRESRFAETLQLTY
jgi:chorismate mutase